MVPLPRPPRERRLCDEPSDHATEPLVVHVFTESVGAVLPVDSWMVDSGGFREQLRLVEAALRHDLRDLADAVQALRQ